MHEYMPLKLWLFKYRSISIDMMTFDCIAIIHRSSLCGRLVNICEIHISLHSVAVAPMKRVVLVHILVLV